MLSGIGWGWSEMLWVALISMVLVFFVLILLIYIMKLSGYVFTRRQSSGDQTDELERAQPLVHEEEIAAAVAALALYWNDVHDKESEVLTIMSIKRAYSPWNSKIHGLTHLPDRK